MGSALLKAGDQEAARKYFFEAISIAREMQTLPVLLDALVGEAEIQARQGEVESALEIVTAVSQNHSSSLATKTRAEQLRSDLISRIPTHRVKTITAKIGQETVDSLVRGILSAADTFLFVVLTILGTTDLPIA